LSLSGYLVVLGAFTTVAGVLALVGAYTEEPIRKFVQIVAVLVLALAAGWVLDHDLRRSEEAGGRLDAGTMELAARALAPGSPLACLDGIAGDAVEEACEKALFATPEMTAAAVSYVAAQLSLLAASAPRAAQDSSGLLRTSMRRAVETDRFGIVAHVLAVRGGCTPDHCSAFALLQDSTQVQANLVRRPFEARLAKYMAAWPSPGRPAATTELTAAETPAAPTPPDGVSRAPARNLYFPSAESIPPVNIMTSEPASRSPNVTSGEAPASSRKPAPSAAPPARQPPSSARSEPPSSARSEPPSTAHSEPLPLTPNAQ
jgi:hypothetical protein